MNDYSVGEYVIYQNGDKYELGRIKSLREDGAFVAYHEGETGAKTPYSHMHKLINRYCIADTTLGGDYFKQMEEPCGYEIKALHKASDAGKAMRDSIAAVLIEPAPTTDGTQGDEFEYFDRESLILLIKSQRERIAELMADRPQGEWIDMGDFEKCSVCKGTHLKEFQSYYGKITWVKTPYCPNCGARMFAKDINVPNKKGADDGTAND